MKKKGISVFLALLLGGLGIHKFYLGRPGQGILYLIFCWTFVPAIVSLIEGVRYAFMSKEKFNKAYNNV
ncbi:MAG: TM2 domain-containing protein [Candidatus Komeilibacteria bacterium]|nr:TM2 domain-containing protein [Candidatus Komeilibacteria bacterium]